MQMGVALLPRRCAESEIARGDLVALAMPEIRLRRQVRLIFRKSGERSHASAAFLGLLDEKHPAKAALETAETRGICVAAGPLDPPGRSRGPALRASEAADVRQPRRRGVDLVVAIQQQARRVPRAGDERVAGVRRNRDRSRAGRRRRRCRRRDRCGPRCQDCRSIRSCSVRTSSGDAVTHGRPIISELPKKISANDSPTIGVDAPALESLRRVLARRAAAEVRVHDQHRRALKAETSNGCRSIRMLPPLLRSSSKTCCLEAVEGDRAEEPRRHDAIGVDVVAAQRHAAARRRQ